jgi:5'-methylthioadenosine phosphorylase
VNQVKIGIIGGSGIYDIDGVTDVTTQIVDTPFGKPSDAIILGSLNGVRFAFLPRHARGHSVSPSELNFRANIFAFKKLGVEQVLSISAVGSLKEELRPRDFVIPDQLFDRTKCRENTFFGNGIVAHVGFAEPFCPGLRRLAYDTCRALGITAHEGGTYVCIEGPQFSTRAESQVNRQLGFSVIGMTNIPEAKLAREAEMCYVTVALVTDYDVWKEEEEVTVEQILANLNANTGNAKRCIKEILPRLERQRTCACPHALAAAVVTDRSVMPADTIEKLRPLIGKYIT